MATLIVHPTEDFNSYISLADATALASDYLTASHWAALVDDDARKRFLLQAFRTMQSLSGFVSPLISEDILCLGRVQLEIALTDIYHGISLQTVSTQEKKSEKAGPVERSYYESASGPLNISPIPTTSVACLQSFGWEGVVAVTGISVVGKIR